MIILRQKNCSIAGRFWAGTKEAIKGAASGAKWGAILVPGNMLAALAGKYKLAAKITLAGAAVGAGVGGYLGYNKGVDDYKLNEKLKTPEGREGIKNAEIQRIKKEAEEALAIESVVNYNPKDWITRYKRWFDKEGVTLPDSIYKWMTLYKDFAKTSIKPFYQDLINNPQNYVDENDLKSQYIVLDFTDVFPAPADPSFLDSFDDSLTSTVQFTVSENPDICIGYNYEGMNFEYADGTKFKTFKDALLDWITYFEKNEFISRKQLDVVRKFKISVINKV